MKSTTKRTQRDYSLAFKLTVVDEVEKEASLTNKPKRSMASKVALRFWFGFVSMVDQIGLKGHLTLCPKETL